MENGRTNFRDLVRDGEVHSSVYTDPGIFKREMVKLFHSRWLFLAHESQIAQPGAFVTGSLGNIPVACVRGQDGNIRTFINRCPHRGAQVFQGRSGQVTHLMCPYHGWTFELDGRLSWVPLREEYTASACDRLHDLTQVGATESYRGFIFACLETPSIGLLAYLGHFKTVIDDLVDRSPSGVLHCSPITLRHKYRANWKLTLENLNDTLHARVAHAAAAKAAQLVSQKFAGGESDQTLGMMMANAKPLKSFSELTLVTEKGGHSYFGAHMPGTYGDLQSAYMELLVASKGPEEARRIVGVERHVAILYPGSSWHARYQTVRIIQPLAPDLTEVIGFVFKLEGAPGGVLQNALNYCNPSTSAFSSVITDDLEIYEGIQRSANEAPGWLQIGRQTGRRADTPGTGSYAATSEAYIRNQYHSWLEAVCGDDQ